MRLSQKKPIPFYKTWAAMSFYSGILFGSTNFTLSFISEHGFKNLVYCWPGLVIIGTIYFSKKVFIEKKKLSAMLRPLFYEENKSGISPKLMFTVVFLAILLFYMEALFL
jgi:hypothetical protein